MAPQTMKGTLKEWKVWIVASAHELFQWPLAATTMGSDTAFSAAETATAGSEASSRATISMVKGNLPDLFASLTARSKQFFAPLPWAAFAPVRGPRKAILIVFAEEGLTEKQKIKVKQTRNDTIPNFMNPLFIALPSFSVFVDYTAALDRKTEVVPWESKKKGR